MSVYVKMAAEMKYKSKNNKNVFSENNISEDDFTISLIIMRSFR